VSRGGALAVAVGVVAFLVLVPRRLDALATLLVAGAASAILITATSSRAALVAGAPTPPALHQGAQVLWLVVIVCAGVALVQVAIGLTARHVERPALLAPGRRVTVLRGVAILAVALAVGVAAGVPGELQQRWQDFKAPNGVVAPGSESSVFTRLQAANGNGRYQFWQAAVRADATDPWKGIGPGTFEFWWARHSTTDGFVRDAHNLYLETLGETGIVGLALLGGLLLWLLATGLLRSLRASADLRVCLAAATAGLAAFMTSAALEWVWEMAAIAAAALALGAVIVAGREDPQPEPAVAEPPGRIPRVVLAVLAVVALTAVLVPLAGSMAIDASRAAAASGDVPTALRDAQTAERLQPYAATPRLQRALVLEASGALDPAAAAARTATADEPTNWRTWLVLARIDARRGATGAAVAELRRARSLNPRSTLWTQP
jgi:O-antigen ligase